MIVYEDGQLLVCRKEPGLSCETELVEKLKAESGAEALYCVHRLDRETGGLMVYAKTGKAAASLSAAFAERRVHKRYLAIVRGETPEGGELRDLLYRDAAKNKSYVVKRMRRGVREAVLHYERLAFANGLSLLSVTLGTGRSHQIRVQFASRGFPLVGDKKYGSPDRDCPLALWSASLCFEHPRTGEALSFSDTPPAIWPWTDVAQM